jgi:hypothetical protein
MKTISLKKLFVISGLALLASAHSAFAADADTKPTQNDSSAIAFMDDAAMSEIQGAALTTAQKNTLIGSLSTWQTEVARFV